MPTKEDRKAFAEAIKNKKQDQIRAFLQRDDANRLLFMEHEYGRLPIHDACIFGGDKSCLQLILDAAVEHGIAKEMLEAEDEKYWTCFHLACIHRFFADSLRLLLEYLTKHADTKTILEARDIDGQTCLHLACVNNLSIDSLRLLLEYLINHADIKRVLETRDIDAQTCLHLACHNRLSADTRRLLLEYLSKHADIKKVLEEKNINDRTCLHYACYNNLSTDSLRLLLEYLPKHADFGRMLEERENNGFTCLHLACLNPLSVDSLRLLISFFTSKHLFTRVIEARDSKNKKLIDYAKNKETKQLLEEPDCFEKCRLWLFLNHQDTFLYSLFPNSLHKTCQALKELAKSGLQETPERLTIMLMALTPSASKFREAVDKTDSSAPMASYFDVVKKGDKKSDYDHWRKNIHLFRELCGQWPPSARQTTSTYEGEDNSSCSIQ